MITLLVAVCAGFALGWFVCVRLTTPPVTPPDHSTLFRVWSHRGLAWEGRGQLTLDREHLLFRSCAAPWALHAEWIEVADPRTPEPRWLEVKQVSPPLQMVAGDTFELELDAILSPLTPERRP